MTLYMHAFAPDAGRLMRYASRERLLPPGGDLGYALHAALTGTFGDSAPKPFIWCAPGTRSGGDHGRILCYSVRTLDVLLAHAHAFAEPTVAALLNLPSSESKEMPASFDVGSRLGFRVRIRPVLRTGKSRDGTGGKERDAYIENTSADGCESDRSQCYVRWLETQMAEGGARLERASLESFSLTRLATRDRSGTKSRRDAPTGPDAVATGTLDVADAARFSTLLSRGIGRFRAFGFGMLLLAPARKERN